jgi:Helix-turn-helix.
MLYLNIRNYITENGMKLSAVAAKVGIEQQTFYDMMNGKRKIITEEYIEICRAFNVPLTYFTENENKSA